MSFNTVMKGARTHEGMSLKALASKCGVRRQKLWHVEEGHHIPSEKLLRDICTELKLCTIKHLAEMVKHHGVLKITINTEGLSIGKIRGILTLIEELK